MFKILAVNSSPRHKGNSNDLLNCALKPLIDAGWQTKVLQLGRESVRGCAACFKCFQNKDLRCVLPEDAVSRAMAEIFAADALLLGSPVYLSDITSEMKALIDRTGLVAIANDNALKGKIGAGVVAQRRGGAMHAYDTLNHFFQLSCMIVPGSTFWNLGFGEYPGDILKNDPEAVRNMENLGKAIAWLGKLTIPQRDSYPALWNRYTQTQW